MDSRNSGSGRDGWIHRLGAIGAILVPLALLIGFLTSEDSGNTSAELISYAEENSTELWFLQVLALLAPLLLGPFVASLWSRMRPAAEALRALTVIGGTLFIAFFSVGMTLWAAPLLENDDLNEVGAEAYLTFDDAGWVLLGLAGISIATMIIAVSLAALGLGWLPKWAAWVSLLLGVLSLATIAAVGIFAWSLWLIAAGVYLLVRPGGTSLAHDSPRAEA